MNEILKKFFASTLIGLSCLAAILSQTQVASANLPHTGNIKTAVIMVNFTNDTRQPFTSAFVNSTVFDTTNRFFQESSYGLTSLSGDVYGWYTMNIASTCDSTAIYNAAVSAAQANGVTLANYQQHIYV